ncbi:ornithine carbamoyltransferase, mitochondrial-like [Thrips palmi]|uniref:ornithine carbamoyltransferase n=1 Tax=Thrips palmi TaxID=161013 RepID=A0A6P9AAU9_THRPL|nr:ornithine carbamoyltransferase, mitochondrial-like [Thrips palmi]
MSTFRRACFGARHLCTGLRSGLVGRDVVDLRDLLQKDIKSILWSALDLKSRGKGKDQIQISGTHVTLLMSRPEPFIQAAAGCAVSAVGSSLTTIVHESLRDMDQRSVEDLGRTLSATSDVILVQSEDHGFISKLATGATIPTVAWHSEKHSIVQALADTMTIYEHFNLLSPLTLSWVGPPKALFNSYLFIMPRMKINLRFCCNDSDSSCQTSPSMMNEGIKNAVTHKTEFHECQSPAETVYRTDIIVTTGHDIPSLCLRKKDVDEASLEYLLLHELPRGKSELSEELFRSKHSATWKSRENVTWITMAILINVLQDFRPSIRVPKWELE